MNDLKSDLKALDGSVIVVKSKRPGGLYIDAHHTKTVKVTGCRRSQLLDAVWSKFVVHYVRDNIICLESLRYRDHYLDTTHHKQLDGRHIIKITPNNDIPKDLPWALFSVWGEDLSNVGIRSERWTNRWLDAHHSGFLRGTKHDPETRPSKPWGQFELMFSQPIMDQYETVVSEKNSSTEEVLFSYTYKLGMSRTDGKSVENAVTLNLEAQKNFAVGSVKFGAQYSTKWSESSSSTFSAATEITTEVKIPPGKTATIKQLRAKYGPLRVESNHLDIIIE